MTNIYTEIQTWGRTLPYWQQIALSRIIDGETFTKESYEELLQYLLEDSNLVKRELSRSKPKMFESQQFDAAPPKQLKLQAIRNVENVNGLASGQEIRLGPALSVIYGDNGAGKSSYSRFLASAAFSRGVKDVLPDIRKEGSEETESTAQFELADGTKIDYIANHSGKVLDGLYVFDTVSVDAHLSGQNSISFSPAGLKLLQQLGEVTGVVH
ncbi:MAG: AAA family ATPase, partial [Candidatus Obscuribacterales bacterium]|nr:AAA family ATPase [Candidatus Obscuribacterales bacterium]